MDLGYDLMRKEPRTLFDTLAKPHDWRITVLTGRDASIAQAR
jgi:hypothetical protein